MGCSASSQKRRGEEGWQQRGDSPDTGPPACLMGGYLLISPTMPGSTGAHTCLTPQICAKTRPLANC